MKILILCTGNSCRSQMAHGFLQSFDPSLKVCSAGTEASGMLNPKAVEVMQEIGIDISHHTSDSVDIYLGEEWDYVITVCGGANETFAIGTDEFIQSEYIRVREEIKQAFWNFYTEQIKPAL
jgi:arsenate reductase